MAERNQSGTGGCGNEADTAGTFQRGAGIVAGFLDRRHGREDILNPPPIAGHDEREAIASGEVRCLVMDLTTRRAVPVPQFARDAFNKE
ncbi:MAG: hypothetical protein R3D29_03975 [Nitratireductor sp.]